MGNQNSGMTKKFPPFFTFGENINFASIQFFMDLQ